MRKTKEQKYEELWEKLTADQKQIMLDGYSKLIPLFAIGRLLRSPEMPSLDGGAIGYWLRNKYGFDLTAYKGLVLRKTSDEKKEKRIEDFKKQIKRPQGLH